MSIASSDVTHSLESIRDYIRWAASQFSQAELAYGQGTLTALDEAAALVLFSINQPYQLADSYLDCRLTQAERDNVVAMISQRIEQRIPSAYITHDAVFAGLHFYVDQRVLVPRSPIAELIEQRFQPWVDEDHVLKILDVCTGSACIAIACAYAFPQAQVDAVELSEDACAVAQINLSRHGLDESVNVYQSDLFSDVPPATYDIIVSNPPYVSLNEWQNLPAEFLAEPDMGFKGGDNGLDLVLKILVHALDYLSPSGILVVEVGSSAETLQQLFPDVAFYWLDFEHGGDGVFLLTAQQLTEHQSQFKLAL